MTQVQPLDDADSMTDWVIETASRTGINSYALWELAEALAAGDQESVEALSEELSDTAAAEVGDILHEAVDEPPSPRGEEEPAAGASDPEEFDWSAVGDAELEGEMAAGLPEEPALDDIGEGAVSQAEYEQFQAQVKDTIQGLIDFLISYDMLDDGTDEVDEDVIAEFRRLTTEFEDDVDEFFSRIDESIDGVAGHGVPDDEMTTTVAELREAIGDLKDATEATGASGPPATTGDSGLLSTRHGQDAATLRDQLGRLNRTLDEHVEFTRREPEPERKRAETGQYDAEYEKRFESRAPPAYRDEPAPEEPPAHQYEEEARAAGLAPIDFAWLGAGVTYGGTDMFSTALVLGDGGNELNPIFDLLGGTLAGFVLWKTFVLMLLFVFFYPERPDRPTNLEWYVPLIVIGAGVVLTVSNLMQVF